MFLVVKYRIETQEGTLLFLEHKQIPAKAELDRILGGFPFAFSATNEFREGTVRYMSRNRVVCTKSKDMSDGKLLYVSLYLQDLAQGK